MKSTVPFMEDTSKPKSTEAQHPDADVRLHICQMSMANIIMSLASSNANSIPSLSRPKYTRKKSKKKQRHSKDTPLPSTEKPIPYSYLAIDKYHYSIRAYFTPNKGEAPERKEKYLLIKESSNSDKSSLIMGLIEKRNAEQSESGIDDGSHRQMSSIEIRIKSALEQSRRRIIGDETNEASTMELNTDDGNQFDYHFHPFSVPLNLNEFLMNKSSEKIFNVEKNNALQEGSTENEESKRYDANELAIQHFIYFIPALTKINSYQKGFNETGLLRRRRFDYYDIDFVTSNGFLRRKRQRGYYY